MNSETSARPALDSGLSAQEFQRWYWLKSELIDFARSLDIKTAGSKTVLTERIAATLDGQTFQEPATLRCRGTSRQLSGRLSLQTVIPQGQRCSQVVRAWMTEHVDGGFHFDKHMREFFAQTNGTQTLQDAAEHWLATRGVSKDSIDPQFEYNRFTRAWYEEHPDGTRHELLAAWRDYRARPIDERGRI